MLEAAYKGHDETVAVLIESKANVDLRDKVILKRGRGKGSGKCGPPRDNVVLGVGVVRGYG